MSIFNIILNLNVLLGSGNIANTSRIVNSVDVGLQQGLGIALCVCPAMQPRCAEHNARIRFTDASSGSQR